MMRAAHFSLLVGCMGTPADPVLRIEPAEIDVDVELGVPRTVPIEVFADGERITATVALEGAALGSVDANAFVASGSIAGRAQLAATYAGVTSRAPVRVKLHVQRFVNAPAEAPQWFRAATETIVDAALEPGDGAVLPPNLGRLDVHFAAADTDDLHELSVTAPDLDLRVYAAGAPGARTIALTPMEWFAIAESNLGAAAQLDVRSMRTSAREHVRASGALLAIAELPIARELMFTGRVGGSTDQAQMWSYELAAARTTPWIANMPAGNCLGCHVALSKDGRRIAAGGSVGGVGSGLVMDVWTRTYAATPSAAIGNWIAAAYDPFGNLVSTSQGRMTIRDGTTALPLHQVATEIPAGQPAVSNSGELLAFAGGPIDSYTTNPAQLELRVQPYSPNGVLGPSRVLVEQVAGETVKTPEFSPDDEWLVYTKLRATGPTLYARRTDASEPAIELVAAADYGRFASPLQTTRAGGDAEPMAWLVMKRYSPVGARAQGAVGQLWAAAFFPARGVVSRPVYLSGQRTDVAVIHAPLALR
jgi:hypothetical protein